ncbi:MAG: endolytic transglycosylase MltG [Anaerolineales bacterium]|nr:endolytic transglycosylase MltG [Anaerolineales bacterium]
MRIRQKRRRADALATFVLLAALLSALLLGAGWMLGRFGQIRSLVGEADPDLNPLQHLALAAYLALYADELTRPAGADATPRPFVVALGETAEEVAGRLAEAQLIRDARLLTFYLRYTGLDKNIEAGDFILRQTMTTPEIARALTDAGAREITVRIPEGWRREQIAELLAANPNLDITAEDWLALTGPGAPPLGPYALYADLPPGASLEGYLFPETYLVWPHSSARDVLAKMLAQFDAQITPELRAQLAARGLTLHQAVIIASLIEREAVIEDERPIIASVIFNRLAAGQPLEIDASVQYALGAPGNWWPPLAGLDLRSVDSPFNTYRVSGLPAGPISNVRAGSLRAAANPAQTGYYFYRAACDGSGRHNFAATYEEHLANACP